MRLAETEGTHVYSIFSQGLMRMNANRIHLKGWPRGAILIYSALPYDKAQS